MASERPILDSDQPFGIARNAVLISDPGLGTPITGAGPSKPTKQYVAKRIQFAGTFAGGWSVDLEGTVDGDNWVTIQAAVVAAEIIEIAPFWKALRLDTNTVGTLTSTGSPYDAVDQPSFTANLGGLQLLW